MNTGGEAAEQVVRMSLEGVEVAAKISGKAAISIMSLLVQALKEEQKTRGKARLSSMLRSGKELKVFTVKQQDLKKFTQEAKRYGMLYCVLADRKNKDPNAEVDIIARAEDAAKFNRIMERFQLNTEEIGSVVTEIQRSREERSQNREAEHSRTGAVPEAQEVPEQTAERKKEELLDRLLGKEERAEVEKGNPFQERMSRPSERISDKSADTKAEGAFKGRGRTSIRRELRSIQEQRRQMGMPRTTVPNRTVHPPKVKPKVR